MPVTADSPAPYAPASAVLSLVERHRRSGLTYYDADVLARAGISSSLIPRTLQAMQTLDLIGGDGKPTPVFESLRLAPEAEFKAKLAEWLTEAYSDALTYVDPSKDDEVQIRDAFRGYHPVGQQPRMVSLFMGLFSAAGMAPEKTRATGKRPPRAAFPKSATQQQRKSDGDGEKKTERKGQTPSVDGLPPAIAGLLASLPTSGNSWGKHERDRFLHTFEAVLDFCFPVARQPRVQPGQEDNEDGGE